MSQVTAILEHPAISAVASPFANQKLAPVFRHNDITKVRRVLDVGADQVQILHTSQTPNILGSTSMSGISKMRASATNVPSLSRM